MKLKTATNPKWANAENTMIDIEVDHPVLGVITFTSSPDDVEEHGRDLFARAVAGDFGTVADYVPPIAQAPTAAPETPEPTEGDGEPQ